MTKHEPGLWAELNEYISDITVDEPPYREEAHMQI
jgi:hypothetical protein